MDRLLKINGNTYKAAEFDVNFLCEMEENNIQMEEIEKKMFKAIRMFVALSMGTDLVTAGKEITEFLKNGGTLDYLSSVMAEVMTESDFFRTKQTDEESPTPKRTGKKTATEKEDI